MRERVGSLVARSGCVAKKRQPSQREQIAFKWKYMEDRKSTAVIQNYLTTLIYHIKLNIYIIDAMANDRCVCVCVWVWRVHVSPILGCRSSSSGARWLMNYVEPGGSVDRDCAVKSGALLNVCCTIARRSNYIYIYISSHMTCHE